MGDTWLNKPEMLEGVAKRLESEHASRQADHMNVPVAQMAEYHQKADQTEHHPARNEQREESGFRGLVHSVRVPRL